MVLKITRDTSANLNMLRQLEGRGLIEIFVVEIEGNRDVKLGKVAAERREFPGAVIESEFGLIGRSVIMSDDNIYTQLEEILEKHRYADVLHLERHIESGRDVFVTEDTDFLSKRDQLAKKFGVKIQSPEELVASFDIEC